MIKHYTLAWGFCWWPSQVSNFCYKFYIKIRNKKLRQVFSPMLTRINQQPETSSANFVKNILQTIALGSANLSREIAKAKRSFQETKTKGLPSVRGRGGHLLSKFSTLRKICSGVLIDDLHLGLFFPICLSLEKKMVGLQTLIISASKLVGVRLQQHSLECGRVGNKQLYFPS